MTVVCSFDVFDTVLTRVFARPADLFSAIHDGDCDAELGGRLAALDWAEFARQRVEAERRARRVGMVEEITLEQIYGELGKALELEPGQRLALMQAEIALERRSVRPIPITLAALEEARSSGKRILFLSDMYLPYETVWSMLKDCGAYQDGDRLYLSNQVGLSKATGNLFRHVLAEEGVRPGQLHHFGDNVHADVGRAHELGIRATHVTSAHLNRYERTVANASRVPLLARSLVAGASRLARLHCPYDDEHRRAIWSTGASLAGPILTGYVAWLLGDAHERGRERIYFVSRDGQILLKIARIICHELGIPLDCRYLYGSRQAWHLPAVTSLGAFEYDWILSPTDFLSVTGVLRRVALSPQEVAAELAEAGFGPQRWERNLDARDRERLQVFVRSGQLDQQILSRAAQARQEALRYFAGEGLFDAVPYAVVDIGWNGRLQRSLGNILTLGGEDRPMVGYYFGLRARIDPRPCDELYAYLWDGLQSLPYGGVGFQTRALMEIFAAADHGGVVGYEGGGDPRPVLLAPTNRVGLDWGVAVQQEAIASFVEALDVTALEGLANLEWRRPWADLLQQFFLYPTLVEARAYGRFPVAEDQNEVLQQPLAQRFTVGDIVRALGRGTAAHHHNEWRAASKLLTPLPVYGAVRLAERAARAMEHGRLRGVHGR
jgi:FMN phosphatase YigB (HAD superfamily)